jgi:hypothetical protein
VTRVDLGALIKDGLPEPERICDGRLYLGQVHLLAGEPEAGKTTLALWWALDVVRADGNVVVLDEESGARQVARRLAALGAQPEDASAIQYHEFPARDLVYWQRTAEAFAETGEDDPAAGVPNLIIVDSAAAAMVRAKLDENSNADATTLWSHFITMARSPLRPAVVIIDHVAKAQPDGRYSRGASAKLAHSDVMYRLDQVRPFSREEDGALRLVVTKDREGCLRRHARLRVTVTPAITFAEDAGPPQPGPMPPARAKLYEALDSIPRTITDLTNRVARRHGHGLRRETASRELTRLARDGLAVRHETAHRIGTDGLWSRAASEPDPGRDDGHRGETPGGPFDGIGPSA